MSQFGKLAEKIGILVQGGTVHVGQIRLDSEMSRQELRNRKVLLNHVRTSWVEGVLEKSLHEQIPIVLGLENRPSAIASPWNLDIINPDKSCQPLPAGTPVIDVFAKLGEGGTLLILGEPGSGKTITLLQLARDLITRAEEEIDRRIPVVLNLSSWAAEKQTIAKWIVEELNSKYKVPRQIVQQWVEKQELLLLLDGLDEIRDLEKRNACVTALNAFQQEQATEMVVCCRMKDYEKLGHQLKLQSALVLQPLTSEQIQAYLERFQSNLTLLKTLLIKDATLQELAQSPLLLNIMVLVYQGIEVSDSHVSTIASIRKKQLFDDYIDRIFQGSRPMAYRPNSHYREKNHYSRKKATYWLVWMAQQMIGYSQTPFLIENLQPFLLSSVDIIFYRIGNSLIYGLIYGLWFGLIFGLIATLINGLIYGLIYGLIFGLISGLTFGWSILNIEQKEYLSWSGEKFKRSFGSSFGMITALSLMIGILSFGVIYNLIYGMSILSIYLLLLIPICMLSGGLYLAQGENLIRSKFNETLIASNQFVRESLRFSEFQVTSRSLLGTSNHRQINSKVDPSIYPNQFIRKLTMNAMIYGSISSLLLCLFYYGIFGSLAGTLAGTMGIVMSLVCFGGITVIQHAVLRMILHFKGRIPWNYAKFLDWASDKLFLQKVGGGYIFIHRSLMEHFAEMENG